MKHKLTLIILIFVVVISGCSLLSINKDSDIKGGTHYNPEDYVIEMNYHDDFRILQLGDIHLGNKDNLEVHYAFLDKVIKDSDADLIILLGDVFTYATKSTVRSFFTFLDSYNIPWTLVFGNHDEQCFYSIDWLTSYLNDFGSNCLFRDIQDDDVFGNSNFVINLMENGKVHSQLIFMDSNRYYFGKEYLGYDFIKPSQIKWYSDIVDYTLKENGKVVDSLVFMHIPLPEFSTAWDLAGGQKAQDALATAGGLRTEDSQNGLESHVDYSSVTAEFGTEGAVLEYGEKREKVCAPEINSGLFDVMVDKGSTKAVFAHHDHINNFRVLYKGIHLCYGVNSTDRIYRAEEMMGGDVTVINADNSLSFEHVYHTYKEEAK